MRILSKVALLLLCLLQGALLSASSSEELETLKSGVEEEFEIVDHLTYEEKTDEEEDTENNAPPGISDEVFVQPVEVDGE